MQTIHYPIKGRKIREVITQRTLDMLIAQWENRQQGPGVIGRLNLHSCWGTASVLDRGYQGETVTIHALQMRVVRRLYEQTRNPKWKVMLDSMASHLLYLRIRAAASFMQRQNLSLPLIQEAARSTSSIRSSLSANTTCGSMQTKTSRHSFPVQLTVSGSGA